MAPSCLTYSIRHFSPQKVTWRDTASSDPYSLVYFGDGLSGDGAGLLSACFYHLIHEHRLLREVAPFLPDRREAGHERVREQALAIKAPDLGCPALLIHLIDDGLLGRRLVEREDRADVRVALVRPPDAGRIGHHRLELGADRRLGIREIDRVVVTLAHLPAVRAGDLRDLRQEGLRLGKYRLLKWGEAPGCFARLPEWGELVHAHGGVVGLVEQNIRRLQGGGAEGAVGGQVAPLKVLPFLLVRGVPLQPRHRRDHGEEQM